MNDAVFSQIDFGPLKEFIDIDDITDISYTNGGQLWLKSLSKGVYRVERPEINNALIEKLAFQCSNVPEIRSDPYDTDFRPESNIENDHISEFQY